MTSRIILDIHALQNVPPSNLNRDDTGAPKTAVYGGVIRPRVSSQAWKRATRRAFDDLLDARELGVRTKRVTELLADRIRALSSEIDEVTARELAAETLRTATGSKIEVPKRRAGAKKDADAESPEAAPESSYLMFLSSRQFDGLAELAVEGAADIKGFLKNKDNKARAKQIANSRHSVDIALFGRMIADSADINVDAAAQVAHAIAVHRGDTESDYFTAVDDRNTDAEPGAGMIGTVDFNSATLYRYAALDVDLLERNLGKGLRENEAPATPVRRAVETFVHGFLASLPTGKINTFGNHTLPDAVVVKLRSARPISFVSAFEKPVLADHESGGYMEAGCAALADYIPEIERAFGAESTATWVLRVGPNTHKIADLGTEVASLSALVQSVGAAVAERLEQRG
ncbi:type I-E CRISPR-associated protein Cas7/Cse4/CasC [Mangrovactinospora gilvigrisea]|uniref:Type I-E CRISPR-associated protein Cas7/Cse4/CasC n=1 Tax=Mangrovactinospora gilvigrisea TaxID=1428644 RepID=A0A1J7C9M6_9ACTN|nr:type I-E CRISPR-associated protein Cas7/Cse4/CasC [Mangrovactinospora gilvigrisea]OIV38220.1 type I-E CRISPR-associated protein Cas7/Cse4/CasC [Mangrovactinospora gilvigrisea]